ncbi:MAG: hypothetical protein JNL64_11670 [Blastocatellia bacterium]|nr:hypothetical protein [Blastocatellia bacterium]
MFHETRRGRQERSGQSGQPERGLPARTLRLVKHAADSKNAVNGKKARDSADSLDGSIDSCQNHLRRLPKAATAAGGSDMIEHQRCFA